MTKLFRLDASIRTEGSVTRTVADAFQTAAAGAFSEVVHREIGTTPLPGNAWRDAVLSGFVPPESRSADQRAAHRLATELADELATADTYLFAIPLYNFGVAQQAKVWIDLLLTEPRFSPKAPSPVQGRPAYLVTARGGGYGPGTPRHGWDHSTPWLKRILTDKWGLDVQSVEVELTLADSTPEMEALRPLAAENLRQAIAAATRLGSAASAAKPASVAA